MSPFWIVVNIGCIECGVSTEIVGSYATEAEAQKVAKQQTTWREDGQSYAEVFEVKQPLLAETP